MDKSSMFLTANNVFLFAWLCLLASMFCTRFPRLKAGLETIGGQVVPLVMFASFFAGFLLTRSIEPKGDILTFQGIVILFSAEERLLNVWIELLALMLVATRWIIHDSAKRGIHIGVRVFVVLIAFISAGFAYLAYFICIGIHGLPGRVSAENQLSNT